MERFFTGGRLRNKQVIHVYAELAGVLRVECVFDVNESCESATFLSLSDDGERQCGFTGRLRAKNFDDPTTREAADAEGTIDQEISSGDDIDINAAVIAEAHDGGFPELLLDV